MLPSPSLDHLIQSFLRFKEEAVRERICSPDPSSHLCKFIQIQTQSWGPKWWIYYLYRSPLLFADLVYLWQSSNSKIIFFMYLFRYSCSIFPYQKLWFTMIWTLMPGPRTVPCTWKMLNNISWMNGWMSGWKEGWIGGWVVDGNMDGYMGE